MLRREVIRLRLPFLPHQLAHVGKLRVARFFLRLSFVPLHDQFVARCQVFKIFGAGFHLYAPDERMLAFSRQKEFRVKEGIRVFTGEAMSFEILTSQADLIIENTFTVPRQHQAYLETHSCLVWIDEQERIQVWASSKVPYQVKDVSPDMSFLEMLDVLNEELQQKGEEPIAFDSDCREGICGACSLVINGVPHGPDRGTAACQLHMRRFRDGDTIIIEPGRARAFPPVKDLVVDRSAFDRIIQAGGFVSENTGGAQDGNCIPVPKGDQERAMDAATALERLGVKTLGELAALSPTAVAHRFGAAGLHAPALASCGASEIGGME